ncbi:MAG: integrin alpha [Planctomycetes bacterium]|nr:integrin alpha [Planctomycetota bacterium]
MSPSSTGIRRNPLPRFLATACAASVLAAAALPQGYPVWEATGPFSDWQLGGAISATGDLDGDGLGDLLVGLGNITGGLAGPPQDARVLSGANGLVVFPFSGTQLGAGFGRAVSGVGDTDGDGVRDLLVGAPFYYVALPTLTGVVGQATLYSGATGLPILTLSGTAAGARFGWAVAGVGDQNLDGYADVLVGSPGPGTPFGPPGSATILSGFDGSVLLALTGISPEEQFGYAVSEIGDLDGDSVPDVIVGAPFGDPSGLADAGEARVFSAAGGAVLYTVSGTGAGDLLGWSVAGPLDTTGDGLADLLVGAPQASDFGSPAVGPGYVVLHSGATGAPVLTLTGGTLGDRFGHSVGWTGDLDGDGLSDFSVGAPRTDGIALPDAGRATIFSAATGTPLLAFSGSQASANAGWAATGVGDANGDGVFDVAVGSPTADAPTGTGAGRVTLLSPVGIPAGSGSFGTGCAGTGGIAPTAATFGGPPTPGNGTFGLSVSRGMGGTLAFLFASTALDPVGISIGGCSVHLAGSIFFLPPASILPSPPGVPGAGFRLRNLPVPPDPALIGAVVPFQWALADGGSPNGLFTTSNAVAVAIL